MSDLFSPSYGGSEADQARTARIVAIREEGQRRYQAGLAANAQYEAQQRASLLKPPELPAETISVDFAPFASQFQAIVQATTQKLEELQTEHRTQLAPVRQQLDGLRSELEAVIGARTDAAISGRVGEARQLADRKAELEIKVSRLRAEQSQLESQQAAQLARLYEAQQGELDRITRTLYSAVDEARKQLDEVRMRFGQAAGARRARAQEVISTAQQAAYEAQATQEQARAQLQYAMQH